MFWGSSLNKRHGYRDTNYFNSFLAKYAYVLQNEIYDEGSIVRIWQREGQAWTVSPLMDDKAKEVVSSED